MGNSWAAAWHPAPGKGFLLSRTSGSPGLQEFDIKLIDTVDLEGGPGTQFAL